ncbi:hypothetical protein [Halobaculum litoreum]|nr:hypothetical protein [Halobaculum sp. DT92]
MTIRESDLPQSGTDKEEQSEILTGEALGECVAETLRNESLGVMVESPPRFSAETMIARLNERTSYSIGMAIVGIAEADVTELAEFAEDTSVRVTEELSTAIKWRNETETEFSWGDQKVPDRIVVFVRGDPPKLNSLHRLTGLPLGRVRVAICDLMSQRDEFSGNSPAEAFWEALGSGIESNLTIRSIARFAVSCLKDTNQESLDAIGQELHELSLFADSGLLSDAAEIENRLIRNGELVDRTIHITNRDRKRLINSIKNSNEGGRNEQAAFIERLRRFQRTNDDGLLAELEFEKVADAFDTTSKRLTDDSGKGSTDGTAGKGSTSSRYNRRTDGESVGIELVHQGEIEEASTLSQQLDKDLDEAIENDEKRVEVDFGDDEKLIIDVDSDLTHFINRFITEDRFGGIVKGGSSRTECISNYTTLDLEYFLVEEDGGSFQKMRKFAERNEDFESLVESFDAYLEARGDLLPVLKSLIHRPLVRLVGDDDLMEKAQNYLSVYQKTQKTLDRKYMSLRDASAQGSRRLLSDFLLLDTIILDRESGRELILSPLHPLHLWKYVELAKAVRESDGKLSESDWKFLETTVDEQPHVLSNITVGGGRLLNEETYLIQSDELATLPIYTEADRAEPGDNVYLWDYLISKFNQAYPPSKNHFKISIVDPIRPSQVLKSIVDAAENESLSGATIEFIYVDQEEKPLLSGATSNEEEAIINLFGPEGESDAFNILTRECRDYDEVAEHLKANPKHAVIINDQSKFFVEEFERDMDTSINPLYVPKEFSYDAFEDIINISASSEGRFSRNTKILSTN